MTLGHHPAVRPLVIAVTLCIASAVLRSEELAIDSVQKSYSNIHSVHLKSHASITRISEAGTPVAGQQRFEYWADSSGRYRLKCDSDSTLQVAEDVDLGWDGSYAVMVYPRQSSLRFSRTNVRQTAAACPNPLFMMLAFLDDDTDECDQCELRLEDLTDPNRWLAVKRGLARKTDNGSLSQFKHGERSTHLYSVTIEERSGVPVVSRLNRFYNDGAREIEFTVEQYRQAVAGPLPSRIRVKGYDETSGHVVMKGLWTVDSLDLNDPIDERAYQFDWNSMVDVWDVDAQMFLKTPDDRVLNKRLDKPADDPSKD